MRPSILWTCAFAVLLWAGAEALGQGQGKGQGKNNAARVKENAPSPDAAQQAPQTIEPSGKADKGKANRPDVGKGKNAMESAGQAMKGKGKDHQQHIQALDKQLRHEQAKQMRRQARLNRIRELAVQKGDTETVARVDKLLAKVNEVHSRKQQHLQGQKRAMEQPQTEGQQAPVTPPTEPPAQNVPAKPADANQATE